MSNPDKAQRLAAALRENLRRRKAHARGPAQAPAPDPRDDQPGPPPTARR